MSAGYRVPCVAGRRGCKDQVQLTIVFHPNVIETLDDRLISRVVEVSKFGGAPPVALLNESVDYDVRRLLARATSH
jgi:hypothetical protein